MIKTSNRSLSVGEFIEQYGEQDQYELIDGEIVDLEPTGLHEQVIAFLARKFNVVIDHLDLPYLIPHRCLIRISDTTAFRPDLIVLDQTQLVHEPLWQQQPVITSNVAIKLIAEVVSTNWQNDYARKVEDYALLGVPDYWIVDYLGLGGREYIGSPKQPTLTICQLLNEMYEKQLFYRADAVSSVTFPNFSLEVDRIFSAGQR
ncbi:MAG: Uma2 family endonuclease [Leptolyngbyaceae bacterium]|nr:Uma2 family endonuclease [Leptolyngbyaceae bacterium]